MATGATLVDIQATGSFDIGAFHDLIETQVVQLLA